MKLSLLERLLEPQSFKEFEQNFFGRRPLLLPGRAKEFHRALNWEVLAEILSAGHSESYLPQMGHLPEPNTPGSSGRLSMTEALQGFASGRTILIRHSELNHPRLAEIAKSFADQFSAAIDLQLFMTPAQGQGFDWHYDLEDVFVIQSIGAKDYYLRENVNSGRPQTHQPVKTSTELLNRSRGETVVVRLTAGDALYIPAGWRHKAIAVSDSFHLSIGALIKERPGA